MMNDKLTKRLLVSLIVLVFTAAPASAQNMVVDGSFEFGNVGEDTWINAAGDGETFGAWTAHPTSGYGIWLLVDSVDGVMGGTWIIPDGAEAVHIGDNYTFGYITQVISGFNVGQKYEVSLAAIAYQDSIPPWWGTLEIYDPLKPGVYDLQVDFDTSQPSSGGEFLYSSFEFTASGTELELSIINPGGSALNIDDVRVVAVAPVIIAPCENAPCEKEIVVWEEGETTDCFTAVLIEAPEADVTMTVDPSTADVSLNAEAPNDPITLTFTTADWNVPQTVTVKANDDALAEGLEVVVIGIDGASTDSKFVFASGIGATVVDNDAAGVVVVESQCSTDPGEVGTTDSYTISLTFAPTDDVDIHLLVSDDLEDANQVVVDPANLTFTPANWQTPQSVTVTAVDDDLIEANPHPAAISHTVTSTDDDYNGFAVDDVAVNVGENDCDFGGLVGVQTFSNTDLDLNCFTDITDFALFVSNYLHCSLSICP